MGVGIIVSEVQPVLDNKYTWFKPSTGEWFEWSDAGWIKISDTIVYSLIGHSHPTHGDINFTGLVSANGSVGLTGQKVIAGYTFTFKKGLLVGFQAP